jgi:hypothetical protein
LDITRLLASRPAVTDWVHSDIVRGL